MARDRDKIEAFKILLGDDFADQLAPYRQDLSQLQVGDDDEANAQAIETWLATRPPLNQAYQNELTTLTTPNSLLGEPKEMGVGHSKANTKASSLQELLDNAQKRNTPPPPSQQPRPKQKGIGKPKPNTKDSALQEMLQQMVQNAVGRSKPNTKDSAVNDETLKNDQVRNTPQPPSHQSQPKQTDKEG